MRTDKSALVYSVQISKRYTIYIITPNDTNHAHKRLYQYSSDESSMYFFHIICITDSDPSVEALRGACR